MLETVWSLPIEDYTGIRFDRPSHSIAVSRLDGVAVIDSSRGVVRWSKKLKNAEWVSDVRQELAVAGALAFLQTGITLSAVRLADGRETWRTPVGGGRDHSVMLGEAIVVAADAAVTALDVGQGSRRWQWRAPDGCDWIDLAYGEDTVVAMCEHAVYRIDGHTGRVMWHWSTPHGCLARNAADSARVVGVTVSCGATEQRLYVFDARSGGPRWQRGIPWPAEAQDAIPRTNDAAEVFIAAGTVSVGTFAQDRSDSYTLSGTPIQLDGGPAFARFLATVDGGAIYRGSTDSGIIVGSLDLGTGSLRWKRSLQFTLADSPDVPYRVELVDGLLYLLGSFDLLWPAAVDLIDARTGEMSFTVTASGRNGQFIGVDDSHTMYATLAPDGNFQVVALRISGHGTGFLGTAVPASSWPDACGLLSANQVRRAFPDQTLTPTARYLDKGDVTLPAPPQCQYLPQAIDGPEITVEVNWVADTPHLAQQAAANQGRNANEPRHETVGQHRYPAWRWEDGWDGQPRARLSFAVGRCLANVGALYDNGSLNLLAGYVADNLADPSISPGCIAPGDKEPR